jgi:SAM-dependent methyltransferase
MQLYDFPQYYEIAVSYRDVEQEADFLASAIARYSAIPVRRVFEVASGPAPHAEALVKRGYQYMGLDCNRNMLDYAIYKWRKLRPQPLFFEANMLDFAHLPQAEFAFVMLGSLYLNTLDEMTAHFDCMAKVLKPGSLYFLDWCVQFGDLMKHATSSLTSEMNGIVVESHFNTRLVDPAGQMYEEVWTVNIDDHGRHRRFEMIERNRAIFPQEFLLFLESRTDFEFIGWWRDWDFDQPILHSGDTTRPIVLIRRK